MLGDINPQTTRLTAIPVVYPGRDHVISVTVEKTDGRRYTQADLSAVTRAVLVFPKTSPTIAYDSLTDAVFTFGAGGVLEIDLSDYAMPASMYASYLILFDAEHPNGQVLVDNVDNVLTFDFRNISTAGDTPPPTVEYVTEAPTDGVTYGRKDGAWVALSAVVAGVASVNGLTGVVVLGAADVGADATGTAAAAVAAHEADTVPHTTLLNLTKVGFNTAAGAAASTAGEVVWNDTDKTLDIGVGGGVTLQAGQEVQIRGLNNSGATMLNGRAVFISGASGNRVVFALAQANQVTAGKTIAFLTQDILNNQQGQGTVIGLVRDIDTSAFAEGNELWLSATVAGGVTNVRPVAPNAAVRIGYVVRSHATLGAIYVRIQTVESLDDLQDIVITTPTEGDVIKYNAATSTWINSVGGIGEVNTASNLGAGSGVFAQKVTTDLQFKSLVAGANVTLTPDATTITIASTGGSGSALTIQDEGAPLTTAVTLINFVGAGVTVTEPLADQVTVTVPAAPVSSVDGQTGVVSLTASYAPLSHVGDTGAAHGNATTSVSGFMSGADKTKLDAAEYQLTAGTNITIDRTDPEAPVISATGGSGGREMLTANRTYYVRTDGSDSNNGLTDSAGGAFLTMQKAMDVISGDLDLGIYNVEVMVGTGTYTTPLNIKEKLGSGTVTFTGNTTTPANVVISTTSANCVTNTSLQRATVRGFKLQTTTSGSGLSVSGAGSKIDFSSIDFGQCVGSHNSAVRGGVVDAVGNYAVTGGSSTGAHWYGFAFGAVVASGRTVTITGTPNFAAAWAWSDRGLGNFDCFGMTFSGSATGKRYDIRGNSVVFTNAAATTYLPGDQAGITSTGAQYT